MAEPITTTTTTTEKPCKTVTVIKYVTEGPKFISHDLVPDETHTMAPLGERDSIIVDVFFYVFLTALLFAAIMMLCNCLCACMERWNQRKRPQRRACCGPPTSAGNGPCGGGGMLASSSYMANSRRVSNFQTNSRQQSYGFQSLQYSRQGMVV